MESCFGTLKTELVHQTDYPTREAAKQDQFAYIEVIVSGFTPPRQHHNRTGRAPSRLIRCPRNRGKVKEVVVKNLVGSYQPP